ncbi:MAG: glycosyltransferase family 2 protein [Candidatus Sabulitectum sp.]|nr:glycosyltransferase family 2 protein [Candidatus Sabulitectum sp.]
MVSRAQKVLGEIVESNWEIIVVDDGSTDSTASITRSMSEIDSRVRLVSHKDNLGFGRAVRTGIENSRKEWIFYTDCDGQFNLDELKLVWARRKEADIVSAYRRERKDPGMRLGYSLLWNTLTIMLFLRGFKDVDSSFKLYRASIFEYLKPESTCGVIDFEILTMARDKGYRVIQLPVSHYKRRAGTVSFESVRSGFIAFVKFNAIYEMFQQLFAFRIRSWRGISR